MALFNLLVNLFGVALWSNWLSSRFDPLVKTSAASLAGTLKRARAAAPKRWPYLAGLAALLLARMWICLQLGSAFNWSPKLKFVFVVLSFRSEFADHMLVFSILSFAEMLAGFYLWLILLSFGDRSTLAENPFTQFVQVQLKGLAKLPATVKLLFPLALGSLSWLALHPLLARMAILPPAKSGPQLLAQAAVMGAGAYLAWKYLLLAVLVLHTLHSYIHFGEHPVWSFIELSARNLLRPLRGLPLQFGRFDFLPLLGIAVMLLVAIATDHPPPHLRHLLFDWLPF